MSVSPLAAQEILFVPEFSGKPLQLDAAGYTLPNGSAVQISELRFYISRLSFWQDDKLVWAEQNSYHLVDAADENSLRIAPAIPADLKANSLHFMLGIDSATNAAGAQGGDLDATKGMYWAWQSGYINLKLEGSSSVCKTRKNAFQFHLGGFHDGNACAQEIVVLLGPGTPEQPIRIAVDVATFLQIADLATQPELMIPGPAAVALAKEAAFMFKTLPSP